MNTKDRIPWLKARAEHLQGFKVKATEAALLEATARDLEALVKVRQLITEREQACVWSPDLVWDSTHEAILAAARETP